MKAASDQNATDHAKERQNGRDNVEEERLSTKFNKASSVIRQTHIETKEDDVEEESLSLSLSSYPGSVYPMG